MNDKQATFKDKDYGGKNYEEDMCDYRWRQWNGTGHC